MTRATGAGASLLPLGRTIPGSFPDGGGRGEQSMITRIAINVGPALDKGTARMLRQSLAAVTGVKQVIITYPDRVEIYYDQTRTSASKFLAAIGTCRPSVNRP